MGALVASLEKAANHQPLGMRRGKTESSAAFGTRLVSRGTSVAALV